MLPTLVLHSDLSNRTWQLTGRNCECVDQAFTFCKRHGLDSWDFG